MGLPDTDSQTDDVEPARHGAGQRAEEGCIDRYSQSLVMAPSGSHR